MLAPSEDNPVLTAARQAMSPLVEDIAGRSEVQAVYVLSSSAVTDANSTRFDEESDFDVAIVLDIPIQTTQWRPRPADTYRLVADRIPNWVPPFLFYASVPWGQMEVNIHQLIYQYETDPRTCWNGEKCDTYVNEGEMVMDQGGAFQELIHAKVHQGNEALAVERRRLANRITWDVCEMPLRQARRLGPEAGHHLLNTAVEEVIDCLYTTHGRFVPSRKWKLAQLSSSGLINSVQKAMLLDAMYCDVTYTDLERRVRALQRFCKSVGLHIDGPAAAEARAAYQSTIELVDHPTRSPYAVADPR